MNNKEQPAPKPLGKSVPDNLINWISEQSSLETSVRIAAITLVKQRDAFGRTKYGQPLMTDDGRKTVVDAMDELGDLLQYLYKAKMNGENVDEIRNIFPVLELLLNK